MPIITANLSRQVFAEIVRLIEKQLYATPQQFLEVAALNQLALERGVPVDDIVGRGIRGALTEPPIPVMKEVGPAKAPPKRKRVFGEGGYEPVAEDEPVVELPKDTERPKLLKEPIKLVRRVPVGRRQPDQPTPAIADDVLARLSLGNWTGLTPDVAAPKTRSADEHIFGQVNRLLPIVFAVRWLGVETTQAGEWPRVTNATDRLGDDAATLGSALEAVDNDAGYKRDDLLATGLPRRGNAASKDRFVSQIVARTTRSGEIFPGAIVQLGLATVQEDRLVLTSLGLDLAKLSNPVLDEGKHEQPTVSEPERDLLVRCVQSLVPAEARDFATLLATVAGGKDTPTDLFAAMRPTLPEQWTDVAARTHVSGVTARAAELGLIRRRWEGRFVKYEMTERGRALLAAKATDLKEMGF